MENFSIITTISLILGAIAYFTTRWRENTLKAESEKDKAEQELISTLKSQIEALERDLRRIRDEREADRLKMKDLELMLAKIQAERDTLEKIFQGRDDDSVKFREIMVNAATMAKTATATAEANNALLKQLLKQNVNLKKQNAELTKHIKTLYQSIDRHLDEIERDRKKVR